MNIKRWNVDFFRGKYFPSILIIFEFDLIIVRARVKERNSIHSRMIGRETRKRVQEGCRRTFEKFDSFISRNGGRKKNLKSASSSRPPPPLESRRFRLHRKEWAWRNRSSDKFLRQGLNREKILSTYASDRFYLRFRTFLFPPFLSPTLSLSTTLLYFIYIYFIRRNG